MVDGCYRLAIQTPMGPIDGKVTLKSNGNNLMGTLECMGMKNSFNNGTVNGNQCSFSGNFNTPMGEISYQVKGVVKGDILAVNVQSNKGSFQLQGKRI